MDIEFDAMPTLQTNGKGVEYTPEQISEVSRIMGKSGEFKRAIREIMESPDAQAFREEYRRAQTEDGLTVDVSKFKTIHRQLKSALRAAQLSAQAQLDGAEKIEEVQGLNAAYAQAEEAADLEQMKYIQSALQMYR